MNRLDGLDRMLSSWVTDPSMPPAPGYLVEILERTRHTRQRRSWASLERWLPMTITMRQPLLVPAIRILALCLALLLALVAATVAVPVLSHLGLLRATESVPMGGSAVLVFDSLDGDLFTIRADGTDRRQLTSGPAHDTAPVWSPDGTHVAFRRITNGFAAVAVLDVTGGDPTILYQATTALPPDCTPHSPAWSPDGAWLVFGRDDCAGLTELLVAPADGSTAAQAFLTPDWKGLAPTWTRSPGGDSAIAFVSSDGAGEGIFVADIPADRRIQAEPRYSARRVSDADPKLLWSVNASSPMSGPMWSPYGTDIAVAGGTSSGCISPGIGTSDAYIMSGGGGQDLLAATEAKEYDPTWAPDGEHLALLREVDAADRIDGRPCTMAVLITDRSGARPSRLATLGTDDTQPPFWSPDGSRIVGNTVDVVDGAEHYDMYIETIDGSSPVVVVKDVGYATWQPVRAPIGPGVSPSPS